MTTGERRRLVGRVFRLTTGWVLLVLGVLGIFLPLIPGLLFIASGLALISSESRWARQLLEKMKFRRKASPPRKGSE